MDKQKLFLEAIRDIAAQMIAAIEDYLGIAYDRSVLAKRREKVR